VLIACGPHVRPGASARAPRIVDLAPTVLSLMGCPVPADMDGRVLAEILLEPGPQPVQAVPAAPGERAQHALSDEEDAELRERLKGFGYLG
jgi:arylsulfatase A-like enzyme